MHTKYKGPRRIPQCGKWCVHCDQFEKVNFVDKFVSWSRSNFRSVYNGNKTPIAAQDLLYCFKLGNDVVFGHCFPVGHFKLGKLEAGRIKRCIQMCMMEAYMMMCGIIVKVCC